MPPITNQSAWQARIEQFLYAWFSERNSKLDRDQFLSQDYLRAGLVDSFSIVNLIVALEDEYDLELSDNLISSSEFRTAGGIARLLSTALCQIKNQSD